jgi:hypothetical protein
MRSAVAALLPAITLACASCGPAAEPVDSDEGPAGPIGAARPLGWTPDTSDGTGTIQEPVSTDSTGAGIVYNTGPVMLGVNIYFILYGSWNNPNGNTITTILGNFASSVGNSKWWNINTLYMDSGRGQVKPEVKLGQFIDIGYAFKTSTDNGKNLTDARVRTAVSNAITAGNLPFDTNGVYIVVGSSDIRFPTECTQICAYHQFTSVTKGGTTRNIKYALAADQSAACPTACNVRSLSPNGNGAADSLVNFVAHEVAEAATDPLLNAWVNNPGTASLVENADLCNLNFGATRSMGNGAIFNTTLGGRNYLIQQNWVPLGKGFCAQRYVRKNDVFWYNDGARIVSMWQMIDGSTVRSFGVALNLGATQIPVGTGDFNGDGQDDILSWDSSSGAATIWTMSGNKQIASSTSPGAPSLDWRARGAADFDGDGISDIFWVNEGSQIVSQWAMNANGNVRAFPPPLSIPAGFTFDLLGDFNGDGKTDILWVSPGNKFRIWYMNGNSVLSTKNFTLPFDTNERHAAFMAGTNRQTVVVRRSDGAVEELLLDGSDTRRFVSNAISSDWTIMAVGDVDGNGRGDLVWRNDDGTVSFWMQAPDGSFSFPSPPAVVDGSWRIFGMASDATF